MDETPNLAASPRQYDIYFAVSAVVCYLALSVFSATQADEALRVPADLRFCVIFWLLVLGGINAMCWMARPHLVHVMFVYEIGRNLRADVAPRLPDDRPTQMAVRRALWKTCAVLTACGFTLTAAIDIGVAVGKVNLHGQNLDIVTAVVLGISAVTAVTRMVGPNLSEIDEVYQAARSHADRNEAAIGLECRQL